MTAALDRRRYWDRGRPLPAIDDRRRYLAALARINRRVRRWNR